MQPKRVCSLHISNWTNANQRKQCKQSPKTKYQFILFTVLSIATPNWLRIEFLANNNNNNNRTNSTVPLQ